MNFVRMSYSGRIKRDRRVRDESVDLLTAFTVNLDLVSNTLHVRQNSPTQLHMNRVRLFTNHPTFFTTVKKNEALQCALQCRKYGKLISTCLHSESWEQKQVSASDGSWLVCIIASLFAAMLRFRCLL